MSQSTHEHLGAAATKIALSAGVTGYGWWTLNNFALAVGALASIAVFVHTILKIYWDAKDRQAGKGAA